MKAMGKNAGMKKQFPLLLLSLLIVFSVFVPGIVSAKKDDDDKPLKPVPKAYASKKMPSGWWTDAKIIAEGKKIFETHKIEYVYKRKKKVAKDGCATCHAINKKKDRPKKRGARDFRVGKRMNRFSESYWFWRISEGVKKTAMPAWKKELTEEEIWKTIAYEHTWSHGNKPAVHDHKETEHTFEK